MDFTKSSERIAAHGKDLEIGDRLSIKIRQHIGTDRRQGIMALTTASEAHSGAYMKKRNRLAVPVRSQR